MKPDNLHMVGPSGMMKMTDSVLAVLASKRRPARLDTGRRRQTTPSPGRRQGTGGKTGLPAGGRRSPGRRLAAGGEAGLPAGGRRSPFSSP